MHVFVQFMAEPMLFHNCEILLGASRLWCAAELQIVGQLAFTEPRAIGVPLDVSMQRLPERA